VSGIIRKRIKIRWELLDSVADPDPEPDPEGSETFGRIRSGTDINVSDPDSNPDPKPNSNPDPK
jgi:hypothetical protein